MAKKSNTPKRPMREIIEELRKPPKPSGKTYINGIIKEQKEEIVQLQVDGQHVIE